MSPCFFHLQEIAVRDGRNIIFQAPFKSCSYGGHRNDDTRATADDLAAVAKQKAVVVEQKNRVRVYAYSHI